MKNYLISVVIPCRNEENYIGACIESLMKQKGVPGEYEIIVVDGDSDDRTRLVLSDLQEKYPDLFVYQNEKKFTPFALNIGIQNSRGKFIAIMGAHSEYDETYLLRCMDLFNKHPEVSGVGGPINSVGLTDISRGIALAMSHPVGVGNAKHRFPEYEGYAEMACFPMFRKELFEKYGMYDESLIKNQDDEFCFRIRRHGELIYISPGVKSTYVVRSSYGSLFRQYFSYGYYRVAVLRKHKIPISYRQQVPPLFFLSIISLILLSIIFKNIVIALTLPILYITSILLTAVFSKKVSVPLIPSFIISILILHTSYSAGFIKGVFDLLIPGRK